MGTSQPDNLDIPDFLRRTDDKASAKEVPMGTSVSTGKIVKKVLAAVTPKPAKAAKPAKTPKPAKIVKAKALTSADVYGYRDGSKKSQAAAMYSGKKGATLEEVKTALGSVQLNLLKDCEARGFKVRRVKEAGDGKRQVTRYFLSK